MSFSPTSTFYITLLLLQLAIAAQESCDAAGEGSTSTSECGARAPQRFSIDGHNCHGVNSFNSKPIVDFSGSSRIWHSAGPMHEVGVHDSDPQAINGSRVTDATPLDTPMATIDAWQIRVGLDLPKGVGPFNVPIARTPTLFLDSKHINDRVEPQPYTASADPDVVATPYRSADASSLILLEQWNSASARIEGECLADGSAVATISIKNGLPNALYTLLDIGVTNALTDQEDGSIATFGGMPNVLTTDEHGYGTIKRKTMYCPLDPCPGSKRCTLYVSLFYHFDHSIYGASPAQDTAGPATGNVGANQVQMFFNAEVLYPPHHPFDSA